jgi:hypothetical protein
MSEREIVIAMPVSVRPRLVKDLLDYAKDRARDVWNKHGEVPPAALMIGWVDGQEVDLMMSSSFQGGSLNEINFTKDIFAASIEKAATQFKASALAYVAEAWMVTGQQSPGNVSFETVPGRREAVIIVYEMVGQAPIQVYAFIEDDGKGTRTLGEFGEPYRGISGRFVHLLSQPPKGTT